MRARADGRRVLASSPKPAFEILLAETREATGERGALQAAIDRIGKHSTREYVAPSVLAVFHFLLGKNDEGFARFESAFAERDVA